MNIEVHMCNIILMIHFCYKQNDGPQDIQKNDKESNNKVIFYHQ
jgi:hypothetical protein